MPAHKTVNRFRFVDPRTFSPENYITKLRKTGSETHVKAFQRLLDIATTINKANGRALLVGGSVRDMFLGLVSKDFDLEVYGVEPDRLEELVRSFGKVSDVGKSFGVLKLSFGEGIDIDISIPRTDSKIGAGHKGFAIKANPNMSIEEAARRRDFTINSMAADPLTWELFDPYGGAKDLKEGVLRVTDHERFTDDPLRILRALQFMGRFELKLEASSAALIQKMTPKLKELPRERILEEWKKLLLKAERPSIGFDAGMKLGIFHELHPEFSPLISTPQEEQWHPEGNVWVHTMLVVNVAAHLIRRENLDSREAFVIMMSALAHDLGKPLVTEFNKGRYISHGHEPAGEVPTRTFLQTIGADNFTYHKVINIVTNHLIPSSFYNTEMKRYEKVTDGAIRRLAKRIHPTTIYELVLVAEADHKGRGTVANNRLQTTILSSEFVEGNWLLARAEKINVDKCQPDNLIRGRDLLVLGYKPGKNIGKLIELSNQLRDEKNYAREMVLKILAPIGDENAAIKMLEQITSAVDNE